MERSSFFNSVNGDRKYKASDFAEYFNSLVTNGVFPNPATNLQLVANNNMTVTLRSGKAWINGYVYINDSDLILPIDVADGVLNRIDRIVLRMDTVGRAINARVKKGTFASSPVAPTLQRDADAYELGIADIYIIKGAVSIVQANITDLRMNTSVCGWVNSLIQADTTAIFNQYLDWFNTKTNQYQTDMIAKEADFTNQFNAWFDSIKNILGTDVAGNLLNQINGLAGVGRTTETVKGNADAIKSLQQDVATHKADNMYHIPYAVATGSANTYAITLNPTPTAYVDGMAICVKINVVSTGASTLNVNGLGAKTILDSLGNAITSGGLKVGMPYTLRYNGTNFIVQGKGGGGNATSDKLLSGYTATVDTGQITGTMPNNGAINVIQTSSGQVTTIPAGYTTGGQVTNNITISSLGGKRWASGTVTASSSTSSFTYINGSTNSFNYVTVTGLNFKPSTIYLKCLNVSVLTSFYDEISSNDLYSKPIKVCNAYNSASYTGITTYHIKGDVAPASIVTGSFTMPVIGNNLVYNWVAYE